MTRNLLNIPLKVSLQAVHQFLSSQFHLWNQNFDHFFEKLSKIRNSCLIYKRHHSKVFNTYDSPAIALNLTVLNRRDVPFSNVYLNLFEWCFLKKKFFCKF